MAAPAHSRGVALPPDITGLASPTHPDETRWYSNDNPEFLWLGLPEGVSDVAGYSYVLDQDPATVPDTTTELPVTLSGFAPKTDYTVGAGPRSAAVGDFNGDGKADLVTVNDANYVHSISVLLGNGNGVFGAKTEFTTVTASAAVAVGDFNGDAKQDLVTANGSDDTVSVRLGRGDGTFKAKTDFAVTDPVFVVVGDFNGDGNKDLATGSWADKHTSVLLGDGSGGFGAATAFETGCSPVSVAIGDFNGDGKQDLVTANVTVSTVSVLLGDGSGSFGAHTDFVTGSNPNWVAVGDVNSDGKADLATADGNADTVSVLLGNGSGGFGVKSDFTTGTTPVSVAIGDFNGDGKQDLVAANLKAYTVSVLLGNGSGGFGAKADYPTGPGPESVAVADFNGDGKQDLATANWYWQTVSVLLNDVSKVTCNAVADGVWYFHVRAVSTGGLGGASATCAACIDTARPRTRAPFGATVRRGRTATLKYKVVDPRPGSPTANVTIRIETLAGKTVKWLRYRNKAVNKLLSARFVCRLAKRTYRFKVYATDQAGNWEARVGHNLLVVN
jgi:hypothetical protein